MSSPTTAAKQIWKSPTRRAFVAMLGLGAAALAVVKGARRASASTETAAAEKPIVTRWIGHC